MPTTLWVGEGKTEMANGESCIGDQALRTCRRPKAAARRVRVTEETAAGIGRVCAESVGVVGAKTCHQSKTHVRRLSREKKGTKGRR